MAFSQYITWYDMRWKEIPTRQEAAYFRTKARTQAGWAVTDHYLTGGPQMTGVYADDSPHIRKGEFQWYLKAGRLIHTCTYVDNKEEGNEIRGTVIVVFMVTKDGKVTDLEVVQSRR